MAAYKQGYDEERFVSEISRNFLCLICFNVLREPVLCSRNQHCFCRACITKHLENTQRCPTCNDELTVETLVIPQRMIQDYLDELNIRCEFANRGCPEVVQLQHLESHEATCGFTPVVCTNQGCGASLRKRDLIYHESELCEFRKIKCHSCGEMTSTLVEMEKRMTKMETNMANMEKNMESKMVTKENITELKTEIEGKFETVNNEVKGLKTALIEGFEQMKDVLLKMENLKEENTRKVRSQPSGDREKENIIVAGGWSSKSVEMFNWRQRSWSPLQSLPKTRGAATSFVHKNYMTIAGGHCSGSGYVNNMVRMNIDQRPDLSTYWIDCPVKLPMKLIYHSSVVYNDQFIVTGGCSDGRTTSDRIDEVQLVPPYTVKTLSRMAEPRRGHSTKLFDNTMLIIGGRTTGSYKDNLNSVVLYDINKNEYKNLPPLPYEVSDMATVRWRDNVVVIGGTDKHGQTLDTVVMYNITTGQSHTLPRMRCKRLASAAVVVGNNIVVLGGMGEKSSLLKSVEAFNFDRNIWENLPEMSNARYHHAAVVV